MNDNVHILVPLAKEKAKGRVQQMTDSAVAILKKAIAETEASAERVMHCRLIDQDLDLAMRKACVILGNEDGEKMVVNAVERMRKWMEGR